MHRFFTLALGVCLVLPTYAAQTVLVLPFFNHSKSANLDWIGESVAEDIRECLASQGLLVLLREDRMEAYRRLSVRPGAEVTHASIIKIGESLDASKVIYGNYELSPSPEKGSSSRGSLRITARMLDLAHLRQGPEYVETAALEELAAATTRLSWQTLMFLNPHSAPSEQEFLRAHPPVRVDAMENYIRGLLATVSEQKHRFFTQASRLDEGFSQPCFQLGMIHWKNREYRIAAGWLSRVRPADSHYLEAQFYLGLCRYYTGDFATAAKCFQLVAGTVPLNEVYNNLGAAQVRLGQPGAIESFRHALEGDSADPDYHFNLGYALWKAGKPAEAAESFRAVLERNPGDAEATAFLGRSLKGGMTRPADPRTEGRERLKSSYEETAYRQLKAELESKK